MASLGDGLPLSRVGCCLTLRARGDEGHGFKGIRKMPSAPETDLIGLAFIGEGATELLMPASEKPIPDCSCNRHKSASGGKQPLTHHG